MKTEKFNPNKEWLKEGTTILKTTAPEQKKPEHEKMSEEQLLGYRDCAERYQRLMLSGGTKNEKKNLIAEATRVASMFHNGKEKDFLLGIAETLKHI